MRVPVLKCHQLQGGLLCRLTGPPLGAPPILRAKPTLLLLSSAATACSPGQIANELRAWRVRFCSLNRRNFCMNFRFSTDRQSRELAQTQETEIWILLLYKRARGALTWAWSTRDRVTSRAQPGVDEGSWRACRKRRRSAAELGPCWRARTDPGHRDKFPRRQPEARRACVEAERRQDSEGQTLASAVTYTTH